MGTVSIKEICQKKVILRNYNYLVVTSGSQYGLGLVHEKRACKGSECLWYPTFLEKGIEQSAWENLDERFLTGRRRHIQEEYHQLAKLHTQGATILVIGAGFVGVEFATEVKHFFPNIKVVIVEQRDECVGAMPKGCVKYCQDYLDRNEIKTIYGQAYKDFMSPTEEFANEITDTALTEFAQKWGIDEPSRIYMAVGLRPINQFLPPTSLTPGQRGGWIQVNSKQQVLNEDKPVSCVFAAGNCCALKGGPNYPKNAFPGEDMASVACHNIRVLEARKDPKFGGCFGFFRPKKTKEMHWSWGTGLCATSLGPNDATLVVGSTATQGTGYTILKGAVAALNKEFVRYTKVDQIYGGCFGGMVWRFIH